MNVSSCDYRSYRGRTSLPPPLPDLLGRSRRLIEVTRITGALSVNLVQLPGGEPIENKIAAAIDILAAANNPPGQPPRDPPAKLTLVYYPYYWTDGRYPRPSTFATVDPVNCPPCTSGLTEPPCVDDPRGTCYDAQAVSDYAIQVEKVKARLTQPGAPGLGAIGQQFFDTERWTTNGVQDWDAAITEKHNLFYVAGKSLLDVPLYQYERAGVTFLDVPRTHQYRPIRSNYYRLDEYGDSYSVSLYMVPDLDRMRAMLQATIDQAVALAPPGVTNLVVVPWVGLACGNRDFADKVTEPFKLDWDYGLRPLRNFAVWLRNFVPAAPPSPTITVAPIGIYPEPFARSTPHWVRYFIDYVRAQVQ